MLSTTVVVLRTKERNAMSSWNSSPTYRRAASFKWVVGLIFILAALYAYFINHSSLFEAATLFGIGVILA